MKGKEGYVLKNIISNWNSLSARNKKLICLMLFSSVTIAIVFLKLYSGDMIFAYDDIGSDTIMQYFPQYTLIINKIRNGTISTWLPEVGYGYNLGYVFIFSPLLLLMFLFGTLFSTQSLPLLVVIYKIVGILLCAYVAFKFLELFSSDYNAIMIGAYLYAFNGFTIIWGQHYVFFDYPLYTILVFYFIEKYLRSRDKKFDLAVILISFACMAYSVYMSYMLYLPLVFFLIIRYLQLNQEFNWKRFISSMLHLALNMIIGFIGGLSTGLLYVKNILDSGRTGSDTSKLAQFAELVKSSYLVDDVRGSLQRFLSANLSGVGNEHVGLSNYYEELQLFFSVLFFVLLIQFVFTIHKTSRDKKQMILKYITVVLVGLAIYNKGILFVLYAFSQSSRRTTFVLFPILAIMVVVVLDNIFQKKILSKVGLLIGGGITAFLVLYNMDSFLNADKEILIVVSLIVLVLSLIMITLIYCERESIRKKCYIFAIVIGLFINVTTEMYISVNREGLVGKEWLAETEDKINTQEAVDYVRELDKTYYRMDKTYVTWNGFTDSYFTNYYPVTTYHSFMTHYTKEYNDLFMNPQYRTLSQYKHGFMYSPSDIVQYSSLGLKYVLSDYPLLSYKHYELIKQIDNVYLYKNLEAESFTTFFDNVVLKSEFEKLGYNDKNKVQQKALIIEDGDAEEFSERVKSVEQVLDEYEEVDKTESAIVDENNIKQLFNQEIDYDIEFMISDDWHTSIKNNIFFELDFMPVIKGTIKIYYDTGNGFNEQERDLVYCDAEDCQIRYVLPENAEKIRVTFSNVPSKLVNLKIMDSKEKIKCSDNQSVLHEGKNSAEIKGNISCDRTGMLYIPLPYDSNWKIKIDGEEVKTYVANAGFVAINITKGDHDIEIIYDAIQIKIGLLCCALAIFMTCIYYHLCKGRKTVRKDKFEKGNV